jgi:adenosylcobinamide-GDP ribazoletransferase
VLIATLWTLAAAGSCIVLGARLSTVLLGIVGAAVVTMLSARWYRARLGGVTGDLLGATEQMIESAVLFAALGALRAV